MTAKKRKSASSLSSSEKRKPAPKKATAPKKEVEEKVEEVKKPVAKKEPVKADPKIDFKHPDFDWSNEGLWRDNPEAVKYWLLMKT